MNNHKQKKEENSAVKANRYVLKGGVTTKNRISRDKKRMRDNLLRTKAFFSFSWMQTKENQAKNKIRSVKVISPEIIQIFIATKST